MKIAVTGCNGSVGSRVVRLALARGYTVIGIDTARSSSLVDQETSNTSPSGQYTFLEVDLTDYDAALRVLRGCEAVVQLAGIRHPLDYAVKAHNTFVSRCYLCATQSMILRYPASSV
jgi:nucleoside-diphosphate-sugar epimerase